MTDLSKLFVEVSDVNNGIIEVDNIIDDTQEMSILLGDLIISGSDIYKINNNKITIDKKYTLKDITIVYSKI